MADEKRKGAIGDSADPRTMDTSRNGARTGVGEPHPENRADGQSVPALDLAGFELDDYDDDKQRGPLTNELPPDQDAGESFREINEMGAAPVQHRERPDVTANPNGAPRSEPTVDNQTNQPDRFHNREPKGRAG